MTSYRTRIQKIASDLVKVSGIENPTDRDVALALDLLQQQHDVLEEMEDADFEFEKGVLIKVNGKAIKFESADDFASFAAGVMHNG